MPCSYLQISNTQIHLAVRNSTGDTVRHVMHFPNRCLTLLTRNEIEEPDGIPRATEEKTWHLPIGVRSPYTSLDPTIADAAWEKIVIGTERECALETVFLRNILLTRWYELAEGWVNISQEKVNDMGQDSIQFDDGSGYFFGLDVFHQLHCLNYIRKKTLLYAPVYQNQAGGEDIPMKYHIRKPCLTFLVTLFC